MAEENITFFENDDKFYAMVDLHINSNTYFDYEDSYCVLINKHTVKMYNYSIYTQIIIKKLLLFFLLYIIMNKRSINFNDKKIKKSNFYNRNKKKINIDDIDVNKILVSKKEPYEKNNSLIDHYV